MGSPSLASTGVILQGMGGFRVLIPLADPARVVITDGDGVDVLNVQMLLRTPSEVLEGADVTAHAPLLIRYPGASRHPAGDLAPVSWMNEEGLGLLRIRDARKGLVVMPLLGRLRLPHEPMLVRSGQRGPSRASDLWLIVAAWSLPLGFTVPNLVAITGLTVRVVRLRVESMLTAGLITHDPQGTAESGARRYVFVANQRSALESLVQERWREWRSGTGHPRLRPQYRYFIAQQDWKEVYRRLRLKKVVCFPSGITFLEGGPGCGPRSWISPGGPVPELFLYTTQEELGILTSTLGINLLTEKPQSSGVPISTFCVLPGDHPAIQLYRFRLDEIVYAHIWPWGIAALDAFDHDDARVRQAAREAWRQWVTNQELEIARHRGREV